MLKGRVFDVVVDEILFILFLNYSVFFLLLDRKFIAACFTFRSNLLLFIGVIGVPYQFYLVISDSVRGIYPYIDIYY